MLAGVAGVPRDPTWYSVGDDEDPRSDRPFRRLGAEREDLKRLDGEGEWEVRPSRTLGERVFPNVV